MAISSDQVHPDERAVFENALRRRAQQLSRLVSHNGGVFSEPLLAMFVGNLLRAAVPLCGDALRSELFGWLARKVREDLGLCPFCGAKRDVDALMCRPCSEEIDVLDLELMMDQAGGTRQ
jgi:hypothetical protein